MKHKNRLLLVLFAISGLAYFPFSQWMSTTHIGTMFFMISGRIVYGLALMAAVIVMPVLVIRLFNPSIRRQSFFLLIVSALFIACCLGGMKLGRKTRAAGIRSFAQRSQTLID